VTPGAGLRWLEALGPQTIRPGLARTRALLASLGSPQSSFRTLLVAGTNGKGSTAATAAAVLEAAGLRVGLTTSPHLVRVNERVRLPGGRDVPDEGLDAVLSLVAAVSGDGALRPTYFEALVVAACELFRRARVEIAVVEVGIGGGSTRRTSSSRRFPPSRTSRRTTSRRSARRSRTWRARRRASSAPAASR
jgi:Folylpolyglutamate synthase